MRILIVHQYFLEKSGAGGSRFNQFAKYWAEKNHQITVISGMVDYTSGKKPKNYKNKWIHKEKIDQNIIVYRCFVSEQYNKSFLGRLWAYFSFTFSSSWAILFKLSKQDIVVATSPPLFVAIPGYVAKLFKKIPLIFELRDLWPKFAIETGVLKNKVLIKFSYWLENFIYKKADLINVLTPAFKDYLVKEKSIPENKIIYIPNAADLDIMKPGPRNNYVRQEYDWHNKFVILYVGAHGIANDLWQIINVAELLKENNNFLFVLIGEGMEKEALQKEVEKKQLKNIQFIKAVPKEKIADFINATDVCTAILQPIFTTTYPNKVFDYMACAKPIILPIDGVAKKLVEEEAHAGIFTKPSNAEGFKKTILHLFEHPEECKKLGENGYKFVQENFDRKKIAEKYIEIMMNLKNE